MPPNSKSFSTLIVCPNSLLLQWGEEAERFTDTFGIHLQHGKERIMDNAQMISLAKGKTIVITSYTTLSKDVANGYYKGVSFLRIVLDEAHEIRNFRGAADKRSRFLERINSIKAEFRWAMTGKQTSKTCLIDNVLKHLRNSYSKFIWRFVCSFQVFAS